MSFGKEPCNANTCSGSSGFLGGYIVNELLRRGHEIIGIDNFTKYGEVAKQHDDHPRYRLVRGDCKDADLMWSIVKGCDQIIAGAAMIGGISYFHAYAYDLLAEKLRAGPIAVVQRCWRGGSCRHSTGAGPSGSGLLR